MSKKCIKCGQPLSDNASFCPHCTAVQKEKQEIKAPKRWRKAAFGATAVVVLLAAVGVAFSLHHRPKSYEGGAQVEMCIRDSYRQECYYDKSSSPGI